MSYRTLIGIFLVGLTLVCPAALNAALIFYDENADGTLSTDNLNPTGLGTLGVGINTVKGAIETANGSGNVDVFSFEVAAGTILTEIRIPIYQSNDDIAVMGVNNANFFPFNPSTFSNTLTLADLQQIIGVAQFGTGWANTVNSGARDLLQSGTDNSHPALLPPNLVLNTANSLGARVSGFKPFETYGAFDRYEELGPGTYTFYLQQTGDNTEYQADFIVVAVIPEPTSFGLVGLFAAAAFARRRR